MVIIIGLFKGIKSTWKIKLNYVKNNIQITKTDKGNLANKETKSANDKFYPRIMLFETEDNNPGNGIIMLNHDL